jgi:hypothetical protein
MADGRGGIEVWKKEQAKMGAVEIDGRGGFRWVK